MINALEIIGNVLDNASKAYNELPNQHTRGMLEGVTKCYQAVMMEMENPEPRQPKPDESIPFSTPPVSETGQMIKHGDGTDLLREHEKAVKIKREEYNLYTEPDNTELSELVKIRELLESLTGRLFPASVPSAWSPDAQRIFNPEEEVVSDERAKEIQREILDQMVKESEELGLYDELPSDEEPSRETILKQLDEEGKLAESYMPQTDPDPGDTTSPKRWNQSFGKGLGGSDFSQNTPKDEVTYDPDTGEQGKVRSIGAKFNPDAEMTVDEWNKAAQGSRVYVDRGNNELEDLQPGE